jgi:hypothetical protein
VVVGIYTGKFKEIYRTIPVVTTGRNVSNKRRSKQKKKAAHRLVALSPLSDINAVRERSFATDLDACIG